MDSSRERRNQYRSIIDHIDAPKRVKLVWRYIAMYCAKSAPEPAVLSYDRIADRIDVSLRHVKDAVHYGVFVGLLDRQTEYSHEARKHFPNRYRILDAGENALPAFAAFKRAVAAAGGWCNFRERGGAFFPESAKTGSAFFEKCTLYGLPCTRAEHSSAERLPANPTVTTARASGAAADGSRTRLHGSAAAPDTLQEDASRDPDARKVETMENEQQPTLGTGAGRDSEKESRAADPISLAPRAWAKPTAVETYTLAPPGVWEALNEAATEVGPESARRLGRASLEASGQIRLAYLATVIDRVADRVLPILEARMREYARLPALALDAGRHRDELAAMRRQRVEAILAATTPATRPPCRRAGWL